MLLKELKSEEVKHAVKSYISQQFEFFLLEFEVAA